MNRKPYNVLLVDLAKAYGGAEVRVLTQARALKARGITCRMAVLEDSPLHERAEAERLPCEVIAEGRGSPALLFLLRDLIVRHNYTVVDAHNVQSIFWAHWAAVLAGARGRVATLHSDFGREYPGLKGWLYEGVLRLNHIAAREYITVTEVLQEKMIRRGYGDRSTLIHNAVPVPAQSPAGIDPRPRSVWGFSPDDVVLAIVARLKPVKGHRYLLEALASLADLPQVKLLVVGDGPLRGELEAQAEQLGIAERVHFTGFVQDVPAILRGVDALCMASLSEALPYVVLEAAAYARPMLVTQVGGMATLLTHEQDALVVPAQDPVALADGIRWLVDHPEEAARIGLAGYALVKTQFSVDTMVDQILEVYDRVAR